MQEFCSSWFSFTAATHYQWTLTFARPFRYVTHLWNERALRKTSMSSIAKQLCKRVS